MAGLDRSMVHSTINSSLDVIINPHQKKIQTGYIDNPNQKRIEFQIDMHNPDQKSLGYDLRV